MTSVTRGLITLTIFCSFIATPSFARAADYTYAGGRGYSQYRTAPNLAPAIAFAALGIAVIVAVAIQNSDNEQNSCHSDSNSSN